MQDSRSQHQNKASAWRILRARLYDRKLNEEAVKRRAMRKSLIKGTDRSDKIRTYNYVQVCSLGGIWSGSYIAMTGSSDGSPDWVHDYEPAKRDGR